MHLITFLHTDWAHNTRFVPIWTTAETKSTSSLHSLQSALSNFQRHDTPCFKRGAPRLRYCIPRSVCVRLRATQTLEDKLESECPISQQSQCILPNLKPDYQSSGSEHMWLLTHQMANLQTLGFSMPNKMIPCEWNLRCQYLGWSKPLSFRLYVMPWTHGH